mgnify:CR=1 FL=1
MDDILTEYTSQEEGQCTAVLNVEEPRADELFLIRWTVEQKDKAQYNGKETITHNLKDEKVHEINFTAYIDGNVEESAHTMLTYDEKVEQNVKNNTK